MKKFINILILISLASLLLSACAGSSNTTPAPEQEIVPAEVVIAEARLEPIHAANLSFQARGVVEEVFVKTGETVREGDVLVRLSNAGGAEAQVVIAQNAYDTLIRNEGGDRAKLWQAYMEAQIVRAEAEEDWEDLNVDDIEDRIEDVKATVEDRQQDLTDAQEDFDKYKNLDVDNSKRKTAEDDLERAQEDLNQALRDLEDEARERDEVRAVYDAALSAEAEAKHQYEISLDGPNADQLTLAKANLDAAKDALANYVIVAPFNGTVAEVSVKVGEQVNADTRAVSIADFSQWTAETTDVTELEVVKLSVGQKVLMYPDALPELELKGTVTEINGAFTQQGGDILYKVTVQLTDTDPRLKWGMTLEATFVTEQP